LFISEDGELWEYFPRPFCYIEVEVPFICNHLQEEHCFDTRNAVSITTLQSYSDQSGSDLSMQPGISLFWVIVCHCNYFQPQVTVVIFNHKS